MTLSYQIPHISSIPDYGITVLHENENHPHISGNKWWKLKYNLDEAIRRGYDTVLTFGGAYSNHIYATAAAAKELELKSIGVIRGEEVSNKTLAFAKSCGMELMFVGRGDYRRLNDIYKSGANDQEGGAGTIFSKALRSVGSDSCYIIPEGGTNELAMKGVAEWAQQILKIDFDDVYVPVGTGGTIAGLTKGFAGKKNIVGVPVLKNEGFLEAEIKSLLGNDERNDPGNWTLLNGYHHGGYARSSAGLEAFINDFISRCHITIERVYTGKLFFAVFDQLKHNPTLKERRSLVIHTGGLQYLA